MEEVALVDLLANAEACRNKWKLCRHKAQPTYILTVSLSHPYSNYNEVNFNHKPQTFDDKEK